MLDLSQIEIQTEKETQDFGIFTIEPLDQGYGHTIGNSLRRVLLTSLSGASITSVKIAGVRHQFSALSGMSEDIVELILNLKKVRLILPSEKPTKLTLDVTGAKIIKASDIQVSQGAEIVNGDLQLAHMADKKAKLSANLIAENGRGYSLADERKTVVQSLIGEHNSVNHEQHTLGHIVFKKRLYERNHRAGFTEAGRHVD